MIGECGRYKPTRDKKRLFRSLIEECDDDTKDQNQTEGGNGVCGLFGDAKSGSDHRATSDEPPRGNDDINCTTPLGENCDVDQKRWMTQVQEPRTLISHQPLNWER